MEEKPRRKGRPKTSGHGDSQPKIQSLNRALDVLDALAGKNGMTLTKLASQLGQAPATVYRVLSTLEARQVVDMETKTQAWHIGPTAFRLGSAFLRRSSIVERSRPFMRDLMETTGETSNLGIERGGQVMFISQVETTETIRAFFSPGSLSPIHASGIGKALLSCHSPERAAKFLQTAVLERFTDKTISSPRALVDELATIRERGWAFDDEERTVGMRCIAAPIRDHFGEAVAGISISGPTQRLPASEVNRIGALVSTAAQRLSHDLGAPLET